MNARTDQPSAAAREARKAPAAFQPRDTRAHPVAAGRECIERDVLFCGKQESPPAPDNEDTDPKD